MTIRIYGERFLRYIVKIFDFFVKMMYDNIRNAEVSELADEQDSGSCERYAREGSSPFFRILQHKTRAMMVRVLCCFDIVLF